MPQNSNPNYQRDHQANERTFLAWVRTSIALIALGFAIARFSLFLHQLRFSLTQTPPISSPIFNSANIGFLLIIVGILITTLAAWRYNKIFLEIERENYQPNRMMVWIMTAIVTILGILSIPLVFLRDQESRPPSDPSLNSQLLITPILRKGLGIKK